MTMLVLTTLAGALFTKGMAFYECDQSCESPEMWYVLISLGVLMLIGGPLSVGVSIYQFVLAMLSFGAPYMHGYDLFFNWWVIAQFISGMIGASLSLVGWCLVCRAANADSGKIKENPLTKENPLSLLLDDEVLVQLEQGIELGPGSAMRNLSVSVVSARKFTKRIEQWGASGSVCDKPDANPPTQPRR
ncbi:hypothetical protein PAPYR_10614 [Paratrimastix pyriformis]|uniref:Transmembrane protein n=1 Tax=Paratrimastix pyriformis TaxID=342808 RepID=A0ABQ8U9E0_9EUKA|nr:hypothetical protein PAPYR_10614 [Paratrimastix pyriformis]